MATAKVIGKIEVAIDDVKIVGVDGSVRDAVYGGSLYEGEQIISTNPDALFQIKYFALSEPAVYEGVFRVLADGSVISGADAMDSILSDADLADIFKTAAGEGEVAESSGYFPSDVVAESNVLGFGRDEGGPFEGNGPNGAAAATTDENVRPVVGDVFLVQNEVLGVEGAGDLNTISGRLVAIDSLGDTHTFSMVPGTVSVTDTNGVITMAGDSITAVLNPDGTYTISGDFNDLSDGEVATVSFDYTATDQGGLTSLPATVAFTVTGTNDIPVVEAIDLNDNGELSTWLLNASTTPTEDGDYDEEGSSSLGLYSEVPGAPASEINALFNTGPGSVVVSDVGDNPTDGAATKFTMNVENGETVTFNWTFTDTEYEGQTYYNDFSFVVIDGQTIELLANSFEPGAVSTGTFTHTFTTGGTHEITFGVMNDDDTAVDPILQISHVSGGVIVSTENAGYVESISGAEAQLIYETHDTTDIPGVDDTADEANNFFTGTLSVADDDVMNTHEFRVVDNSLVISDPAGSGLNADDISTSISFNETTQQWEYSIDGDFGKLAAGETATVTFQYVADDMRGFDGTDGINESSVSAPATITLTVTGTNDQPIVTNVHVEAVESYGAGDEFTIIPGTLVASDADTTDTQIFHAVGMGDYDDEGPQFTTMIVSQNHYDNVAYYENGDGVPPTDNISVLVQSNDINPNDIDVTKLVFTSNGGDDNEAGFALEGNFNALGAGEQATVTFQYYADDQNGFGFTGDAHNEASISELKTVTITVTGTNDQPVVEYAHFSANEVDDGGQTFAGQLLVSDDDVNDGHTFEIRSTNDHTIAHGGFEDNGTPNTLVQVGTDDNGDPILAKVISASAGLQNISLDSITVDADGQFHVTGDFNALATGETATVRFRYVAVDDSGVGTNPAVGESDTSASRMAEVTIVGTNDQPVVSNVHFDTTEVLNGMQTFDGQLSLTSDDDVSDTHTFEIRSTNDHTIAHGGYEADGTPNTLVQVGTDDNGDPILAKVISASAGLQNISLDSITVDADGQFHVTGDFNALATGETATVRFRYVAVDDSGVGTNPAVGESDTSASRMAEVTIMGTNDAPVIIPGQTDIDFVSESAGFDNVLGVYTLDADGNPSDPQIIMTDTNGGGDPAHTQLDLPFGSFGLFLIPNGDHVAGGIENATLSFDPANPTQLLVDGSPVTAYYDNNTWNPGGLDHFDVVTNGDGSVNISIEDLNLGDNDRTDLVVKLTPLGGSVGGTVVEIADGAPGENASFVSTEGTLAFDDLDLSDTHTSSITYTPDSDGYIGSFNAAITTPATGTGVGEISWSFNVHDSVLDPMGPYDSIVQTYTVTVDDGHGGTATQDIAITIQGTNDAPVATADVITKVADHVTMDDVPSFEDGDVTAMTYNSFFPWVTNDNAEVVLRPNGRYAVDDQNEVSSQHWSIEDGDKPNFVDSKGVWNEGIIFNFNHNVDEATINLHNIDQNDRLAVAIYDNGSFVQFVDTSSIAPNHQVLAIDEGVIFDEVRIFALDTNHCNVTEFTVDSVVGNYEMDTVLPFVIDDAMLLANDTDVDGDHLQVQLDDGNLYSGTNVVGSVALNADGDIVVTPDAMYEFDHSVDNAATFNYSVVDEHGAQSAPVTATIDVALGTITGNEVAYNQEGPQEFIIGTDTDTTPEALSDNILTVSDTLSLSHVSAINTVQLEPGATVEGSGSGTPLSAITASDVISATDTDNTLIINSSDANASDQVNVDTGSLTQGSDINIDGMAYASYSDGDATLLIQIDDQPIDTDGA